MNKAEYRIDLALQEPMCTVLNPGNKYKKDKRGITTKTIPRKGKNLVKLENTISQRMQALYQQSILEVLEMQVPILYIDCSKKGDDDILFFIFKEGMKGATMENKETFTSAIIGNRTIIQPNGEDRNQYMQTSQLDLEGIFHCYDEQLKKHLATKDSEYINKLLDYECDICIDGLIKLMENQKTQYLSIFVDNIANLTPDEQKRVNTLLYCRGMIDSNKRILLKLNNGNKGRKTRQTASGKRAEATHDYSDTHIYEEDL